MITIMSILYDDHVVHLFFLFFPLHSSVLGAILLLVLEKAVHEDLASPPATSTCKAMQPSC